MTEELEEFVEKTWTQDVDESAFVDPTAKMMGDVMISSKASLWPGVMIKGERSGVEIEEDAIVMHRSLLEDTQEHETILKENSFVSASSKIHGATIGKDALVGINAVVLEGAEIGQGAIVGTNAIVPEDMEVPEDTLAMGKPAEEVREVSEEEKEKIRDIRKHLSRKRDEYKLMLKRGEKFDVFEPPKRPDEIEEEFKEKREGEKDPDDDMDRKSFKELDLENYFV